LDTTGLSRWYFNFTATAEPKHLLRAYRFNRNLQLVADREPFRLAKLTLHRLKPGGVPMVGFRFSCEIEVSPAEARWCPEELDSVLAVKLKYHRLKPGGVKSEI